MSTKPLISYLLCGLSSIALAEGLRAEQEATVAPATPHQLETIKGDLEPAAETVEESKPRPDGEGYAAPASPHQEQVLDEPAMHFDRLDVDHDGSLSNAEAAGEGELAQEWEALDVDRDGSLNPDEVAKFFRSAPKH